MATQLARARKMVRRENPETALVRATLRTLHALGVPAYRVNSGMFHIIDERSGKTRWVRAGIVGAPDITGWISPHGRRIEIECKVGDRAVTPEQAQYLRDVADAGGVAVVVRDDPGALVAVIQRLRKSPLATMDELLPVARAAGRNPADVPKA